MSDTLLQLQTLPGNSTNPAPYPFEIKLVYVKSANQKMVEENPSHVLLGTGCQENGEYSAKMATGDAKMLERRT